MYSSYNVNLFTIPFSSKRTAEPSWFNLTWGSSMRKCLRLLRHPLRVLIFGEQNQSIARGIDTHLVTNKMWKYEEIIYSFCIHLYLNRYLRNIVSRTIFMYILLNKGTPNLTTGLFLSWIICPKHLILWQTSTPFQEIVLCPTFPCQTAHIYICVFNLKKNVEYFVGM